MHPILPQQLQQIRVIAAILTVMAMDEHAGPVVDSAARARRDTARAMLTDHLYPIDSAAMKSLRLYPDDQKKMFASILAAPGLWGIAEESKRFVRADRSTLTPYEPLYDALLLLTYKSVDELHCLPSKDLELLLGLALIIAPRASRLSQPWATRWFKQLPKIIEGILAAVAKVQPPLETT